VKTVDVNIPGRPYSVFIEPGLLARLGDRLRSLLPGRSRCYLVTVPPVRRRWGKTALESLKRAGFACSVLEMPDGERHKTLVTVGLLAEKMVRLGADRKAVIVALGGGVAGDVAGFLASIYMRGVELVQVPTTLLAQVDASIGGKTGVDLPQGKNLLGTFFHPRAVYVDPQVLGTLPEREYRAGLYECLKYGVIRRREIFHFMEENRERIRKRDAAALEGLIAECVAVKAEVVAADEREGDLRRILNFGHTVGHALEAASGYRRFLHGEAVGWGMVAACKIAAAMGRTDEAVARRVISAVLSLGPLPPVRTSGRRLLPRLASDKKTLDGVVHFILPLEIGRVEVAADVPGSTVIRAVDALKNLKFEDFRS
jgi:3-dehydroquinate synthase